MSAYGHVIPMLEFAKCISAKQKVSMVVFDHLANQIVQRGLLPPPGTNSKQKLGAGEANFANIRVIGLPSTINSDFDAGDTGKAMEAMMAFPDLLRKAFDDADKKYGWSDSNDHRDYGTPDEGHSSAENFGKFWPGRPVCLSVDFFYSGTVTKITSECTWARDVPFYPFVPTSAKAFADIYLSAIAEKDNIDINAPMEKEEMDTKETFQKMTAKSDTKGFDFQTLPRNMQVLILSSCIGFPDCSGLLLNTFHDLEAADIAEFVAKYPKLPPIREIGPLCGWEIFADRNNAELSKDHKPIISWLDQQAARSVLYVSFGSVAFLEDEQVRELEKALRDCGHPFLWSLRPGAQQQALSEETRKEHTAPDQKLIYVKDAKKPGLISTWCPQRSVLAHPAIGGYVSHCGWNSSQEAITAGVPVITWPMFAEQHANADFLQKLNVAVPMPDTKQYGRIVKADEIKTAISKLLDRSGENKSSPVRNAAILREKAKAAISEGGHSRRHLDSFPYLGQRARA